MSADQMTDSMKAEFIKAFQEKFGFGVLTASANDYAAAMLGAAAWAWKASRAAIEVELPSCRDSSSAYFGDACYDPDELAKAIESLGVRVKP